jgi:hypothetical protein
MEWFKASDILKDCLPPTKVIVDLDERVIHLSAPHMCDGPYSIEFDRFSSPEDVVDWLAHLSAKRWADQAMLRMLGRDMLRFMNHKQN